MKLEIQFHDETFGGARVFADMNQQPYTKTHILAVAVENMMAVLRQMSLQKLGDILRNKTFIIPIDINELNDTEIVHVYSVTPTEPKESRDDASL